MRIIPAIDLSDGKAVRLSQGDFARKTVYGDDPVGLAIEFETSGLKDLHIVDLDGARFGNPRNLETLHQICERTQLRVDFGGGVREAQDVEMILGAGASQVTVGSIAARKPELFRKWIGEYGAEKFILGADARAGKVAVAGWMEATEIELEDFIKEYLGLGVLDILCTSIERDGMLTGPDLKLYRELGNRFPEMRLLASGGVSGLEDLEALQAMGISGAIIGKAFYEGRISLEELARMSLETVEPTNDQRSC